MNILKPIYFVFLFGFFFVPLYPLSDGIDWRNQTPLREKSPFSHRTGTYTYINKNNGRADEKVSDYCLASCLRFPERS